MPISIPRLLTVLREEYGDQAWWPGETPFEVAVGAILTQRASWTNAEASIRNLKSAGLLNPEAIVAAKNAVLEEVIRPSGFYRQKARYLRSFSEFVVRSYGGRMERMRPRSIAALRAELLGLAGIGPETADSILLYALGKESFVVDAYTYRLMTRLGWKRLGDYAHLKAVFELALGSNVEALSDMHALIVAHCKTKCKKTPDCFGCTLGSICPSKREQE